MQKNRDNIIKFSIVIPTYNEENDIRDTLESLILLNYPYYEILVIDDSTDSTPKIVSEFQNFKVKLIKPAKPEGRCEARNLGILNATGDVVIILNADVHLPINFLHEIKFHYDNGADYVLVRSVIKNSNDLFARYVESSGICNYYGSKPQMIDWTEGFSCKKELAIRVGMFPTGHLFPIVAGEDKIFGEQLRFLGANKIIDSNIVCTHVAPAKLSEYWRVRKGRGEGTAQIRRFIDKWSYSRILSRACYRILINFFCALLLVPMLIICYRYSKESPRGLKDLIPFCWGWMIEKLAFSVGEFTEIIKIYHKEKVVKVKRSHSAVI